MLFIQIKTLLKYTDIYYIAVRVEYKTFSHFFFKVIAEKFDSSFLHNFPATRNSYLRSFVEARDLAHKIDLKINLKKKKLKIN